MVEKMILNLWLFLLPIITAISNSTQQPELAATKISKDDNNSGFISIDCGVTQDYRDANTGIWYEPDTNFVETGTNHVISSENNIDNPYFGRQLRTLRSFPQGKRNCYTLKPKQGKNNNYLIRTFFAYGNYDNTTRPPTFDLYVGVYYWDTIPMTDKYYYTEVNYAPSTDTIDVCLVNTDRGVPYISTLELRPLNNSIYQTVSTSLPQYLQGRYGIGILSEFAHTRFKDDVYDRIWNNYKAFENTTVINGATDEDKNDAYDLPAQVVSTAIQPQNGSSGLDFYNTYDYPYQYYVYLYFLEFERHPQGQKRVIKITIDDKYTLPEPITLEYMKPLTVSPKNTTQGHAKFSISAAAESDLPPILNALDIYRITPQTNSPTDIGDVNAILEIKQKYNISRIDWQGDPCAPPNLAWTGLNCSTGNNSRIISVNLSSSNLAGEIATSFFNLTRLENLDLSNNELTGQLPEFLAEMTNLRMLDLSGNKLTGSVPRALKEKLEHKTLQLSLDGNPGLDLRDLYKKRKFVVPLVSCIAAVIIIAFCSLMIWRHTRKRRGVMITKFKKGSTQIKTGAYSNSEILSITDNFKTIIGEGGFGKVYLGTLYDNTQVAVKLLSLSSEQGDKAFQSEVELLTVLHHRNLVSLIGYCNQGDVKALIYEYMDNGNLHQKLSENNPSVLKWTERLQIAVDAAKGLDYLHNGCRPPVIHRDLKTSNVLLNANMQAKIADFGLSRAFANDNDTHLVTTFAGTLGYLDPQFRISKKSDIYSFGIILFELITGQPAIKKAYEEVIHMCDWVIPYIEKGEIQNIIDQRLEGNFSIDSAQKAIEVAMSCISIRSAQRPDISYVLTELQECLALEITHGMGLSQHELLITDIYPR